MRNFFLPRIIRWVIVLFVFFMIILSAYRLIFFYHFQSSDIGFRNSLSSFWLGVRYDARLVAIILVPLLVAGSIWNPFNSNRVRKIWFWYLGIFVLVLLIFCGVDFYYYDYLTQRLNSNILNFMQDAGISFRMMWQSYPLLRILLILFIAFFIVMFVIRKLFSSVQTKQSLSRSNRILSFTIVFLFLAVCIYGKVQRFPLRWSDAFALGNNYKANLALNPFQSFFSSLTFRHSDIDIQKVRKYYPYMADYLEVQNPDSIQLNFKRVFAPTVSISPKPNVILVICESFSAYKSSMWSNPLKTTPFFDSLCRQGLFFNRCFTPHFGTARGVWATVTGVPDVQLVKTASRNPAAVEQQTIINDFQGYEKFYFLGGNASWANIRGLLTNNINDLHLYEEDDYSTPKIDVWGISDMNLFMEANKILSKQQKPFFAIIQTSDNHRPYTIPEADKKEFKKVSGIPTDTLNKYGFESIEELNAFRYTDFCYQKFMETAAKEKYMNNTLFVFVGDHGIRSKSIIPFFPQSWFNQGLACEHVPLLFYFPQLVQPRTVSSIASQVDILPTIAGILNVSYTNTGMGKDLYRNSRDNNYAFIIDHDTKQIGVVHDDYYFGRHLSSGSEDFVSIINNDPIQKNTITDSIREKMSLMTDAFYATARYLLLNNRKRN